MEAPTTRTSQSEQSSATAYADALTRESGVTLRIEGAGEGRSAGYSVLLQGEVQASSILSNGDPEETVMLLEDDTKLLSGTVSGETAGFVLDGRIVAAEFDDPEPTVRLDGAVVDPARWPTVKEYTGFGPGQEPVEDPFPESGELGAPSGDPLNPEEYVVELDAEGADEAGAYCFDVDGAVVDHPDSATVPDKGDRVYGYLCPGWSAEITVRGLITRIDTADGIDFSVRARDDGRLAD